MAADQIGFPCNLIAAIITFSSPVVVVFLEIAGCYFAATKKKEKKSGVKYDLNAYFMTISGRSMFFSFTNRTFKPTEANCIIYIYLGAYQASYFSGDKRHCQFIWVSTLLSAK